MSDRENRTSDHPQPTYEPPGSPLRSFAARELPPALAEEIRKRVLDTAQRSVEEHGVPVREGERSRTHGEALAVAADVRTAAAELRMIYAQRHEVPECDEPLSLSAMRPAVLLDGIASEIEELAAFLPTPDQPWPLPEPRTVPAERYFTVFATGHDQATADDLAMLAQAAGWDRVGRYVGALIAMHVTDRRSDGTVKRLRELRERGGAPVQRAPEPEDDQ